MAPNERADAVAREILSFLDYDRWEMTATPFASNEAATKGNVADQRPSEAAFR